MILIQLQYFSFIIVVIFLIIVGNHSPLSWRGAGGEAVIVQIRQYVLVAASAYGQYHDVVGFETELFQSRHSVRTLYRWDYSLGAREFIAGIYRLVIVYRHNLCSSTLSQVRVHRTDAGIVESCTDGERFLYLSVVGLHDQRACSVYYALRAAVHRGGGVVGVNAVAALKKISFKPDDVVVLTVSGRGDKDVQTYLSHKDMAGEYGDF